MVLCFFVFSCCSIVTNIIALKLSSFLWLLLVEVYSLQLSLVKSQDFLPQLNYDAEWKDWVRVFFWRFENKKNLLWSCKKMSFCSNGWMFSTWYLSLFSRPPFSVFGRGSLTNQERRISLSIQGNSLRVLIQVLSLHDFASDRHETIIPPTMWRLRDLCILEVWLLQTAIKIVPFTQNIN